MILERLTVRNWRRYREPHTFQFDEGLNLLVGRNEAGKSTLFEALQRGLFDRHNGKASEIRAIQPLDSSLGPEVEIVLRAGSGRYRVRKRFLQDATAELYSERDGGWELDHEGDKADERIRMLFDGDVPGRGATKVEHRGLAQALWYLQDEAGVPEASWNDAVEKGLQGLVEVVATTPQEEAIVDAVEDAYSASWTPTGRVSSNSELAELDERIPEIEAELSELRATLGKATDHRSAVERARTQKDDKQVQLAQAREELAEHEEAVAVADELEEQREALEAKVEAARAAFEEVHEDLETVQALNEAIENLETKLEAVEDELAERRLEAKEAKRAAQRSDEHWKQELEPELKTVESELTSVQALERRDQLAAQATRLTEHLAKVTERTEDLEQAQDELREMHAPDEDTIDRVLEASARLEVNRAKMEASAIRVRFELDAAPQITPEPDAEESEGEYLVTRPTTFQLGDLGHVHVRGGGETLEELETEADELREQRQGVLGRYGVGDLEALQQLHQERVDLEARVDRLRERLNDLAAQEEDPQGRLDAIRSQIQDLEAQAGDVDLEEQAPGDRLDELRARKQELVDEIEAIREKAESQREKHLRMVERAQEAENKATQFRAELKSKRDRSGEIIARYGTLDQLRQRHTERESELDEVEAELEAFLDDYEARVERPRKLHKQAQRRVDQLEDEIEDLDREIDIRIAKIEQITEEAPYSQAADLEAELERLRERRSVVKVRADGAKLLHELVEAHQRKRSEALAGPVSSQVDRWLQVLTEDGYGRLRLDENLVPTAVESPRYEEALALTELSFGTQEQVVVLLRLAMARLLSEDDRELVVLDDRLVNADPVRMKRLGLILDEASQDCQILLATCNDTPYAGIEKRKIHVPQDGMEGG